VLLCVAGVLAALRDRALAVLAAGPLLYVAYVVWVGGDFMGDRFLSAPVLLLVLPVAHLPRRPLAAITVVGLLASLASPWSPWRSGRDYTKAPPRNGIVDERGYYWQGAGWLSAAPGRRPAHAFARTGERIGDAGKDHVMKATAGLVGYYAGPDTHVVDPLGLTDPLLASPPSSTPTGAPATSGATCRPATSRRRERTRSSSRSPMPRPCTTLSPSWCAERCWPPSAGAPSSR
jgi:hypothetical protein